MLHQFEEHGIDALGRHYAFRAELCATLGWTNHDNLASCPATEWFIFAVNPETVWIAGLVAGLVGPRRVLVGAAALGIPAVNAAAHILPALRTHTYNPGLVTAVVTFVPLCAWTLRVLVRQQLLRRVHVAYALLAGLIIHAVLLVSLIAFERGAFGEPFLVAVQLANGFLPLTSPRSLARSCPCYASTRPRASRPRGRIEARRQERDSHLLSRGQGSRSVSSATRAGGTTVHARS